MIRIIQIVLFLNFVLSNDGEGPLFTNIMSISDFYFGNSLQINTQAIDKDGIDAIKLYYRFSDKDSYQSIIMKEEVNYSATIPAFEVNSTKIQYYFLGTDIFGNQRIFPNEGETNPLTAPIIQSSKNNMDKYEINMIEPLDKSVSEDISIIIVSIYNPDQTPLINRIQVLLNNNDITKNCNVSDDLITYVPNNTLNDGTYELIVKIANQNEPLMKKFYFDSFKAEEIKEMNIYTWLDKFDYSGTLGYTSDYDKFSYADNNINQPDSRPLDIHRFNFNLNLNYKNFDLKSSILFNTHIIDGNARLNKKYKQPIDRIKVGIKYPYGVFNFGDYSTTFTDLTLKGTRVRGLHSTIKIGHFSIIYVRGKTKELIQSTHWEQQEINNPSVPGFYLNDSTIFLYYNKGTPSRNLRALRTELKWGNKLNFGITGLTSYDVQDVDIPYSELYSNYLFMGNALIGSDLTLFFNNKRTWLSMETAISMTNDILDENINNYITNLTEQQSNALGAFEDIIGFSITTDLLLGKDQGRGLSIPNPPIDDSLNIAIDSEYLKNIIEKGTYKIKFKSPLSLFNIPFNINGEYKRIPFSFVSFGNPSIPKDIQGLTGGLKTNFFNNKIILNIGYNNNNDNVNDYKLTTTNTVGNNIGINLNFDKIPSINYSRKILNRSDGSSVNNQTITHTIAPNYKLNLNNFKFGINSNLVIMNYRDLLATINNNFQQLSFSNSVTISNKKITFNSGIGISKNKPENIEKSDTDFLALSSKISYKPKNNKFSSYIGINGTTGKNLDINNPINNRKESLKIGLQYKINQYSNIKYNFEYLMFTDNITPNNNYSEIRGKLSLKISF